MEQGTQVISSCRSSSRYCQHEAFCSMCHKNELWIYGHFQTDWTYRRSTGWHLWKAWSDQATPSQADFSLGICSCVTATCSIHWFSTGGEKMLSWVPHSNLPILSLKSKLSGNLPHVIYTANIITAVTEALHSRFAEQPWCKNGNNYHAKIPLVLAPCWEEGGYVQNNGSGGNIFGIQSISYSWNEQHSWDWWIRWGFFCVCEGKIGLIKAQLKKRYSSSLMTLWRAWIPYMHFSWLSSSSWSTILHCLLVLQLNVCSVMEETYLPHLGAECPMTTSPPPSL